MHSTPLLAIGLFLAVAGLALFAVTLRRPKLETRPAGQPLKKAELRALEAQRTDTNKMRIAAGVLVAFGAVLLILS